MALSEHEGWVQEVKYKAPATYADNFLWFTTKEGGSATAASAAPTIQVFSPSGAIQVSSVSMTSLSGTSFYYPVDTSTTSAYTIAEGFYMQVDWATTTALHTDYVYFDCVLSPLGEPIVTQQELDTRHPDWIRLNPSGSNDYTQVIEDAHVELQRRIRSAGDRGRCIVKREELWSYELAFAEMYFAVRMAGMEATERDFWIANANNHWLSRGEFEYSADDDPSTSGTRSVGQSRATR